MPRAEPLGERADARRGSSGTRHRAAITVRRDLQIGVAAGGVDVVMLEERRRRQHDVGHRRGLGHELLVDADEEIVARKAARAPRATPAPPPSDWCSAPASPSPAGRRRGRAGRRSAPGRCATGRGCGSSRSSTSRPSIRVRSSSRQSPPFDRARRRPRYCQAPVTAGRQAHREELRRAVARPREAVADPDIAALGAAVEPGEVDDLVFRKAR